jgi:hypothetical protein
MGIPRGFRNKQQQPRPVVLKSGGGARLHELGNSYQMGRQSALGRSQAKLLADSNFCPIQDRGV